MAMNASYMPFYLEGRTDEDDDPIISDDDSLDIDKLAETAMAGGDDLRTILTRAVTALAAPLEHGKDKADWIAENKRAIKDAGGDAEEAYKHYCKGVIDEAVYTLETEVLDAMFEEEGDEDEEEEDEDDEE